MPNAKANPGHDPDAPKGPRDVTVIAQVTHIASDGKLSGYTITADSPAGREELDEFGAGGEAL